MSEINVRFKQPFAAVPNKIAQDPNVSADTLACITYLISRGDNWTARVSDIRKRFKWGDHTWRKVSKEMHTLGVLIAVPTSGGKKLEFNPWVTDLPVTGGARPDETHITVENQHTEEPYVDFRTMRKTTGGKSTDIERTDLNKEILENKDNTLCISQNLKFEKLFEQIWERYPLKKGKQMAYKAFCKALEGKRRHEVENSVTEVLEGLVAHVNEYEAKHQLKRQGADIWIPQLPHLSTWLNQGRWTDDYQTPSEILEGATRKPANAATSFRERIKQWEKENDQAYN